MFKRALTKRKKKKGVAPAVRKERQDADVAETTRNTTSTHNPPADDGTLDNLPRDVEPVEPVDPFGLESIASPELLEMREEFKKRSLSAKSQARLDMARWRSNNTCALLDSELVVDPFRVSKSHLTVRATDSTMDDTTVFSIQEILAPEETMAKEDVSESELSPDRSIAKSVASALRAPSARTAMEMEKQRSSTIPFDEPPDYTELLRDPFGTPSTTSPTRASSLSRTVPANPPSADKKENHKQLAMVDKPKHVSSYESILDGPQVLLEEDDLLGNKKTTSQPTHRVLPPRGQHQVGNEAKQPVEATKRTVPFADKCDVPECIQIRHEDPEENESTLCGLCFNSSYKWLFGESVNLFDCNCERIISSRSCNTKEESDSMVETCSSSEDSVDKGGNKNDGNLGDPQLLRQRLAWIQHRQQTAK